MLLTLPVTLPTPLPYLQGPHLHSNDLSYYFMKTEVMQWDF